jgi:hypothetical protein
MTEDKPGSDLKTSALVRALDIRAATWEAVNGDAVRAMASCSADLDLLAHSGHSVSRNRSVRFFG